MRCQDAATAGSARSNRCLDPNASRTTGGRRLCWWRRWLALNEHCRNRGNRQCRWACAGISARSRNQSRAPFECNHTSLKRSNLIEAISLAAGNVRGDVGREADPSSPGGSRPVIRLLWFLLALGPHTPSNRSCGSLRSSVGWLVPQPLPRGGDLAHTGARTRPHASVGVARLVGGAAWGRVAGEAVRGASSAPPRAVAGTRPARSTLRPPMHARARGAAAWAAIRGSLGRPLGRHRLHGGAPPGRRSRARAPRARASREAFCRPLATAYEHAVRRRPVLPGSFIPTSFCAHPPAVDFFPPLQPAWLSGGRLPHPLWSPAGCRVHSGAWLSPPPPPSLTLGQSGDEPPLSPLSHHDLQARPGARHGGEEGTASAAPRASRRARAVHLFLPPRGVPAVLHAVTVVRYTGAIAAAQQLGAAG